MKKQRRIHIVSIYAYTHTYTHTLNGDKDHCTTIVGIEIYSSSNRFTHLYEIVWANSQEEWANSKIIRIKIHYVLEAIAAFKVIFHFCLLTQIHKHTKCGIVGAMNTFTETF